MSGSSKLALVGQSDARVMTGQVAVRPDRTTAVAPRVLPWPIAGLLILGASVTLWVGLGAVLVWVVG